MSAPRRVKGTDGKLYRANPLTARERAQAIRLAHQLVHGDGWSIRASQRLMASRHGLFRSTGAIAADLANYVCPHCDDE
jgi:hypothetical protein